MLIIIQSNVKKINVNNKKRYVKSPSVLVEHRGFDIC